MSLRARPEMLAILNMIKDGKQEIEITEGLATRTELLLLAETLRNNDTVSELRLGGLVNVEDTVTEVLAQTLETNKKLKLLSLAQNQLTRDGAASLARALVVNTTLQSLNLSNNALADDGVIALCQGIRLNRGLTLLALFNTGMTDRGALAVADVIRHNCAIKRYHLGSNDIRDLGCAAIAEALTYNVAAEKIGFVRCHIGDAGGQALIRALERNVVINEAWVENNNMDPSIAQRVHLLAKAVSVRLDWARAVALCSASQPRLGQGSSFSRMPNEVLRRIVGMMFKTSESLQKVKEEHFPDMLEDEEDRESAAESATEDSSESNQGVSTIT